MFGVGGGRLMMGCCLRLLLLDGLIVDADASDGFDESDDDDDVVVSDNS